MTVGRSNASMSEKSRLETLEKQIVAQNRCYKEIVKSLEEAEKAFYGVYDQIEDLQEQIFKLEERFDSHFKRNDGKQRHKCPNTEV